MKKLLVIIAVLAAFGFQKVNAQELAFGAKGGLNFSSFYGDDADDFKARTVFHIGAVAEYMINEQFGIQPELMFSMQGAKRDDGNVFKINYINLPVMAKYYVMEGLSLQVGPQVGVFTSAKARYGSMRSFMNKLDFGLNFGLGYKLKNNLFFDLRYNLGLTRLGKGEEDSDVKNSVFQLSVGYMF